MPLGVKRQGQTLMLNFSTISTAQSHLSVVGQFADISFD
jgi:hypothetical protein